MTLITILAASLVVLHVSLVQGQYREYYTEYRDVSPRYFRYIDDVNPCAGACGIGADCRIDRNNPRKAICSCPRGFTGHPFNECYPQRLGGVSYPVRVVSSNSGDLCSPNPCGSNASCRNGYDRSGNDRPVCTCLPGYIGNGVTGCTRGECESDLECPFDRVCSNSYCQNPCSLARCGVNANCEARNRAAVCSCPAGYRGDPFSQCTQNPGRAKRTTTKEANDKAATALTKSEEAPTAS